MFVKSTGGSPALSILRQGSDDGSLTQETLDTQGNMRSQAILHVPRSITGVTEMNLLKNRMSTSQHGSERVRVLLGVPLEESYSFKRKYDTMADVTLPAMFERKTKSIRVIEHGLQPSIESPAHGLPLRLHENKVVPRDDIADLGHEKEDSAEEEVELH